MKKIIIFSYIFFILIFPTNAYIIESNTIKTVLEHIDQPETLVVFDLDNTLIHPYQELGSDEWFSYLIAEKLAQGYTADDACIAILPYYYYAQHYINVQCIELTTPALLQGLTINNINTIALTARSPFISEITHEQLENINIHFSLNFPHVHEYIIPFRYPCLYRHNILFVSNNDKGEALHYLLEMFNYHPKKIIYVDDKLKYLHSIENAFKDKTELCCIRYSGCDDLVEKFNNTKAQEQFNALQQYNKKKNCPTQQSQTLPNCVAYQSDNPAQEQLHKQETVLDQPLL